MIPKLQPNTTFAIHLRAATATGSKDWVGSVTTQGEIHTYWGKTGHINQHAGKKGDMAALHQIIAKKVNGSNRYQKVDEYHPRLGWESQRNKTPAATPAPAPKKRTQPPPEPVFDGKAAPDAAIKWDF